RAWTKGSIKGIRARGAVEVDLSWDNGKATMATLRPKVSLEHKLRPPRGQQITRITESGRRLSNNVVDGRVTVKMSAGKVYQVAFS
ncbi:MAG TPA: glycoside hydrolase family 95 protein, partial [Blastocatellia bacterium]|nr:glycoside hydrolase family 95 protein [Blastocatellia bacterium]